MSVAALRPFRGSSCRYCCCTTWERAPDCVLTITVSAVTEMVSPTAPSARRMSSVAGVLTLRRMPDWLYFAKPPEEASTR